jgi:hypothetical protein
MGESLAGWLTLREPFDAAARSRTLTQAVVGHLPSARPLRVVDLGSGRGANIRYLSPELPHPQEWLAVDRDVELLASVPTNVTTRCLELGPLDDPQICAGRHLVTASALLDLVSGAWLATLADRCRDVGAVVLFALSYDGRSVCDPVEPEDDAVRELFNRHQRQSDKGFGAAAGPDAVERAAGCFRQVGYDVRCERSDWQLPSSARELQRLLIAGWAQAASEAAPDQAPTIERWLARRLDHVDRGRSRIVVGHQDLAGWPRVRRSA